MSAQPNTVESIAGELHYRASVIDGTALTIADYLVDKDKTLCLYFMQEFYKLLAISVQTKNEEELIAELDILYEHYLTLPKPDLS